MRWLLTTGRKDKALVVLQKIATWNKFAITCNVIDEVNKETLEITQGTASATEKFTIKLLVSSPILLKRYFFYMFIDLILYSVKKIIHLI